MTEITMVMAIYGQPRMLEKQVSTIIAYPDSVLDDLNVVIVDDHGDPPVTESMARFVDQYVKSVKLFRVDKDIAWNQMGARNLGMEHSQGWCLMIDPDMVFDGGTMKRMVEAAGKMTRGMVSKYGLKHATGGRLDMSSPNTFLIHRDDFFSVGGYDEDFAGHKGWSDVQMLDVLRSCFKVIPRPDLFATFYGIDVIHDAAVMSLSRNTSSNRKIRVKNVEKARGAGGWAKWAKLRKDVSRLRFPWTMIYPTT